MGNLPLPAPTRFTIAADFNEACDGGFRVIDLGNMVVPLQIKFQPEGGAVLTSQNQNIELKNTDGTPNGLALRVKENGAIPIAFNEWRATESLSVAQHPRNLYYSAELMKTGAPLVPGTFSQQVTILVTFR
ncbi:hypothetical protein ABW40_16835 [Achromobacter xylosoxidans]|nr:hypothetical protein ABW40_16835 [Achromobacter xylosoxidans]